MTFAAITLEISQWSISHQKKHGCPSVNKVGNKGKWYLNTLLTNTDQTVKLVSADQILLPEMFSESHCSILFSCELESFAHKTAICVLLQNGAHRTSNIKQYNQAGLIKYG